MAIMNNLGGLDSMGGEGRSLGRDSTKTFQGGSYVPSFAKKKLPAQGGRWAWDVAISSHPRLRPQAMWP